MDEQEIREAAYRLWEKQGRPQGQDLENWFTAEKLSKEKDLDKSASESMTGNGEPALAETNAKASAKPKTKKALKA